MLALRDILLPATVAASWLCGIEMPYAQNVQLPQVDVNGGEPLPVRPDLQPENVANFARVAPSSRPHVETFTREDIENLQPSDVFDLLSHGVGMVFVFEGRKQGYSLLMRGDSNYSYIIDGAYVPTATASRILQTMPVSAIEQIDVVRDSTALTLGPLVDLNSASGALNSGFVVIRTHTPSKNEAELRAGIESYGTRMASGYVGAVSTHTLSGPDAYMSGLFSQKTTDGPPGYNAWGSSQTGLIKVGLTSEQLETHFEIFNDSARYGFERARPDQSTDTLSAQRWGYAPINSLLLTSNSLFHWNAYNSTLMTLSYNAVAAQNTQGSFGSTSTNLVEDRTYTGSANLRHSFQFDRTLLQIGGEYIYYNTPTGELAHAGYADEEQTFSGYVHGEQKFFDDRLKLDASVRADKHEIMQGVDIYGGGTGNSTASAAPTTSATSSGGTTTTTTVDGDTTTVVVAQTTSTTTYTRPTSGPGSGTGGGPGSPGAGTGMGNPTQFYTYTTVTTTNYTTTTTTAGVSTTTTGSATTTSVTRQNPPLSSTTTTVTGTVPAGVVAGSSSTSSSNSGLQYFYNRWLPVAKSFSGGASFQILPQLVATARFSHTEQGGLANVISASGTTLDPENQNKWEVGLVAPISPALKAGFNLFDIKIENDKVPTSYSIVNGYSKALWSETNTERFGFELLGEGVAATSEWLGQTNYKASWMHLARVTSSTIAAYPSTISHDVVNGTLTQKWHDYSGTVTLTYIAPYMSNFNSYDGNYHSVGNFVTIDLRLARTFDFNGAQAKFSIYGRNITDRKYETVYGFPSWGAVYGSELSLTF